MTSIVNNIVLDGRDGSRFAVDRFAGRVKCAFDARNHREHYGQ